MKTPFGEKLILCPVCNKKYLKQGFKNHIINSAKAESFIHLKNMLNFARNKPYQFSPVVLLRQAEHLRYYRKHLKDRLTKKLEI